MFDSVGERRRRRVSSVCPSPPPSSRHSSSFRESRAARPHLRFRCSSLQQGAPRQRKRRAGRGRRRGGGAERPSGERLGRARRHRTPSFFLSAAPARPRRHSPPCRLLGSKQKQKGSNSQKAQPHIVKDAPGLGFGGGGSKRSCFCWRAGFGGGARGAVAKNNTDLAAANPTLGPEIFRPARPWAAPARRAPSSRPAPGSPRARRRRPRPSSSAARRARPPRPAAPASWRRCR